MPRPLEGEFAPYTKAYIDLAKGDSVAEVIANHTEELNNFYNNLPEDKADYKYDEGKWTIKEVLQHVIDAERIFAYRALRIARKDATPLPGFDENNYTINANAKARTLASLKQEFDVVRNSTVLLLQSFDEEQLKQKGTASDQPVTVNSLAFIIYGHLLHHKNVITDRYLNSK